MEICVIQKNATKNLREIKSICGNSCSLRITSGGDVGVVDLLRCLPIFHRILTNFASMRKESREMDSRWAPEMMHL